MEGSGSVGDVAMIGHRDRWRYGVSSHEADGFGHRMGVFVTHA
jgi:hypothetical protein